MRLPYSATAWETDMTLIHSRHRIQLTNISLSPTSPFWSRGSLHVWLVSQLERLGSHVIPVTITFT